MSCFPQVSSVVFFLPLVLAVGFLSAAEPVKPSDEGEGATREELITDLEKRLTGAKLTGRFTVKGKEDKPPAAEEYTITNARKLIDGDQWMITARIKYGDTDKVFLVPIDIKWAGETPVMTLDKVAIPGLGTFSTRVVIHEGMYAGTWQHDEVGGHLFGTIERAAPEKQE